MVLGDIILVHLKSRALCSLEREKPERVTPGHWAGSLAMHYPRICSIHTLRLFFRGHNAIHELS